MHDDLLAEQVSYYRARAGEYDEWFFRKGRYDRGPAHREAWFDEVAAAAQAVNGWLPEGDVLELACGTGLWTQRLAGRCRRVVAVDASPEVIAVNGARVSSDHVEYVHADLFTWEPPPGAFDAVFFSFWLSHVPPERFDGFWRMVGRALKPGGRAVFVDSLREQTSTAVNHGTLDESGSVHRLLNDGRSFRIVKVFYTPEDLQERLGRAGWVGTVRSTGTFFLYGAVERPD